LRIVRRASATGVSGDDPGRGSEKMATLVGASDGRAAVTVGRGSFTESLPLYGLDLADYNRLFAEKLDLFALLLRSDGPVSWEGTVRGPLKNAHVYPRPEAGTLRTWIGAGGPPEAVVRAARDGIPRLLAVVGGSRDL